MVFQDQVENRLVHCRILARSEVADNPFLPLVVVFGRQGRRKSIVAVVDRAVQVVDQHQFVVGKGIVDVAGDRHFLTRLAAVVHIFLEMKGILPEFHQIIGQFALRDGQEAVAQGKRRTRGRLRIFRLR